MINNVLLAFLVALCVAASVSAEAEPHSGAHTNTKVQKVQKMLQTQKNKIKAASIRGPAVDAEKTAKSTYVRGQAVKLESVSQPPANLAGNRVLVQSRFYNDADCNENSLHMAGGYAANVCIPEENVSSGGWTTTDTTSITLLKTHTPNGVVGTVVQSYHTDKWCYYPVSYMTETWGSRPLDVCMPDQEMPGKYAKFIASKDVQLPVSTHTPGVLWKDFGGVRGCEQEDPLALVGFTFFPEECIPTGNNSEFGKFYCEAGVPKVSLYSDDSCTTSFDNYRLDDMCSTFSRASCITAQP